METVALPYVPIATFPSTVDKVTENCSVLSTTSSSTILSVICFKDSPGLNTISELTIAVKSDGQVAVSCSVENL